jgi:cytochrome c oxidase assembly factor CtaG
MSWRRLAWVVLVILLASPLVDPLLIRTQPRFLLVHLPAWVFLGYLAGRHLRSGPGGHDRAVALNPRGLTGLVFFVGTLAFWMIPRSVDAAALSQGMDQLLHVSLLAAGFALAWSMPAMPFVLRAALGIYGIAMLFSLGALYTHSTALLCGTFTLAEQRQTGQLLYWLCPAAIVAFLVRGVRSLSREQRSSLESLDEPSR